MSDDMRRYLKIAGYILVLIIGLWLIAEYDGISKEAARELAAIGKPPDAKLVSGTGQAFRQFEIRDHKDNIRIFYDKELRRNGWEFAHEGFFAEFKGKYPTGSRHQYVVYTKGRLKLAVVWLPDAAGMVEQYGLEISEKELPK